jgi:hypothetical protein
MTHTHHTFPFPAFSVHGTDSSPSGATSRNDAHAQETRSIRRKASADLADGTVGLPTQGKAIHTSADRPRGVGAIFGLFGSLRLVHAAPRHEQTARYTTTLFKRLPVFPRRRVHSPEIKQELTPDQRMYET